MGMAAVRIGLLGPLEVAVNDRPVVIAGQRRRVVLAALALAAGRSVRGTVLADHLRYDGDRSSARRSLQTTVSRLRQALGIDVIAGSPGFYRLEVDPLAVDVHRFRALTAPGRRPADPATELGALDDALGLWRGEPLSDIDAPLLVEEHLPSLIEQWLGAVERRADLMLAAGRHRELPAQLRELTARYPLRESLWHRLMVALYRSGRQAEALTAYQQVREMLADQLGVDPSDDLQRLHGGVLTRDRAASGSTAVGFPAMAWALRRAASVGGPGAGAGEARQAAEPAPPAAGPRRAASDGCVARARAAGPPVCGAADDA
ncbi:MAG TPA: AfsR/SARP family transcriptional regulator [Pilimelia sp.]|nr:AfsR/SARP family transcriptional regulator [Pilimelia sp.]